MSRSAEGVQTRAQERPPRRGFLGSATAAACKGPGRQFRCRGFQEATPAASSRRWPRFRGGFRRASDPRRPARLGRVDVPPGPSLLTTSLCVLWVIRGAGRRFARRRRTCRVCCHPRGEIELCARLSACSRGAVGASTAVSRRGARARASPAARGHRGPVPSPAARWKRLLHLQTWEAATCLRTCSQTLPSFPFQSLLFPVLKTLGPVFLTEV